jgi:hypothetical protein
MHARGLPSPDTGDCLAYSFWMDFAPVERASRATVAEKILHSQDDDGTTWMARSF